jgi:hypothetical protein
MAFNIVQIRDFEFNGKDYDRQSRGRCICVQIPRRRNGVQCEGDVFRRLCILGRFLGKLECDAL